MNLNVQMIRYSYNAHYRMTDGRRARRHKTKATKTTTKNRPPLTPRWEAALHQPTPRREAALQQPTPLGGSAAPAGRHHGGGRDRRRCNRRPSSRITTLIVSPSRASSGHTMLTQLFLNTCLNGLPACASAGTWTSTTSAGGFCSPASELIFRLASRTTR